MEDDKLKELFQNFKPHNDADDTFMTRLRERLDTVELIRGTRAAERKRQRLALAVSALVGFLAGIGFSLCLPSFSLLLQNLAEMQVTPTIVGILAENTFTVELLAGTVLVVGISLITYELICTIPLRRHKSRVSTVTKIK